MRYDMYIYIIRRLRVKYIKSVEYLSHLYLAALNKAVYTVNVTVKKYNVSPVSIGTSHSHNSNRPCTDGVRDPTQGSTSLAFSCIGPGLVPLLPVRCHRCSSATGSLRCSGSYLLHFSSSSQKIV